MAGRGIDVWSQDSAGTIGCLLAAGASRGAGASSPFFRGYETPSIKDKTWAKGTGASTAFVAKTGEGRGTHGGGGDCTLPRRTMAWTGTHAIRPGGSGGWAAWSRGGSGG